MKESLGALRASVKRLYDEHNERLLFHGWHHIAFVASKTKVFAESIGADVALAETCALVHDLNHIVETHSGPEAGAELRASLLKTAGCSDEEIKRVEEVILEADMGTRNGPLSKEGMALSDADTLFKVLPITPILFTSHYLTENKVDIGFLANEVVTEQEPLIEKGIYFYTDLAKEKYLEWGKAHLQMWKNTQDALKDKDIQNLISTARERGVI